MQKYTIKKSRFAESLLWLAWLVIPPRQERGRARKWAEEIFSGRKERVGRKKKRGEQKNPFV